MFASATSGDRFNNNKFSECSKTNVSRVLDAITDGLKPKNCFKEKEGAFCGNKIVEPGEEVNSAFSELVGHVTIACAILGVPIHRKKIVAKGPKVF